MSEPNDSGARVCIVGGGGAGVEALLAYYHGIEERRAALPYDIDGLVIKVDDLASREKLAQPDKDGRLPELAELIQSLKGDLWELSDTLTAQYLSHIMTARLMSSY